MKQILCALSLCLLVGCASNQAIYKNYSTMVDKGDGVSEQEAKIIAQHAIIGSQEKRDYRVTAPDVKNTIEAQKYPDFWFVVFGHNWLSPISTDPMAKTYTELRETQYLVVINRRTGDIKFNGQWYPKRADNFDWIFDPDSYRKENAIGLFPGEPSIPLR